MMALQAVISLVDNDSNFLTILILSMVLIWSMAIIPFLPLCLTDTLVGYFFKPEVIGAITIVFKLEFISLGEMMTHGLVF